MVLILVVAVLVVLLLLGLFGGTTIYDRRVAAAAKPWFGTGAGVYTEPLRQSTLLADRAPSLLTNRRVPSFDIDCWRSHTTT